MSNNNRRGAPSNYPQRQRYPERQRNDREGQAETQPHHAQYYPQPYPYPQRNYKDQNDQMGRVPAYNPQMHYNNFYYQQYHPHYPPPYPNAYPQYYPHPQYAPYPHNPNPNPSPSQHKEPSVSTPEKKNYPRKEENWQQDDRRQDQKPVREERKPQQERKPYQEERRSYQQQKYEPRYEQREAYNNRSRRHQTKQERDSQQSNQVGFTSQSDSESQEVIYRRKAIVKKKDPVLDSKQEIRKWIEARKRNYPKRSMGAQEIQARAEAGELSILQKKIRKKILLINADTKSMMKKQKDIDILRRFILYSRRNKRPVVAPRSNNQQPLVREMVEEEQVVRVEEPVKELQKEEVIEPIEPVEPAEPIEAVEAVEEIEQGAVVQLPIKSEKPAIIENAQYQRRQELSVDVIVKHLQMKQAEDAKTLSSLLDYKSNSFHFRYQHQTLETNLLLDNIFNQTSYILQAIRYIVNNKFFDPPTQ